LFDADLLECLFDDDDFFDSRFSTDLPSRDPVFLDQFFDDEDFLSADLLLDLFDPLFHDDFEPYLPDDFLPELHEDFFEDSLFEFDFSEIATTFKFKKKCQT
jgi:hypothetical protein